MRPDLHAFRGNRYLLSELSDMSGVPMNTLRARINDGWTIEQTMMRPTPKQRRAGVVSNFPPFEGTGAGSTAQEIPEITFSRETENA
jgi:hypothetical protein